MLLISAFAGVIMLLGFSDRIPWEGMLFGAGTAAVWLLINRMFEAKTIA